MVEGAYLYLMPLLNPTIYVVADALSDLTGTMNPHHY
jgi:hypothetical protein